MVIFKFRTDRKGRRRGFGGKVLTVQVRDDVLMVNDENQPDELPLLLVRRLWGDGGLIYVLEQSERWGALIENRWSKLMKERGADDTESARLAAQTKQEMRDVIERHVSLASPLGLRGVHIDKGSRIGLRVDYTIGPDDTPSSYIVLTGTVLDIEYVELTHHTPPLARIDV